MTLENEKDIYLEVQQLLYEFESRIIMLSESIQKAQQKVRNSISEIDKHEWNKVSREK